MQRVIAALLAISAFAISPVNAAPDDADELVLLPGQGEFRERSKRDAPGKKRLKPGGGLFITFDEDANGEITSAEIDRGIPLAFMSADANKDGFLTALEQQDWSASLPTRDDSLANPVRFDPNLDRRVDLDEFTLVISQLGVEYANAETGIISVGDLTAASVERKRDLPGLFGNNGRERASGGS